MGTELHSKVRYRHKQPLLYNDGVMGIGFDEIKRSVNFLDEDAERVRSFGPVVGPFIQPVVDCFYEYLMRDKQARAVFTGGEEQIARLRDTLTVWLQELFVGPYDQDYYENRLRIGRAHVRVELPQHYMVTGIELIWSELEQRIRGSDTEDMDRKLRSLHKLLMLDLTIMLESYKESYSEHIRLRERSAVEEKLTRAEHLAEIGQLAASMAHEIKNPLAGISGAIQVMQEAMEQDDPHRPILTEVLGQIGRLDAVVKDLLFYARPTPPRKERVRVDEIAVRVLRSLREEPALQRLHIEHKVNDHPAVASVDSLQIEQLLMNLILNAAHASPDDGVIVLSIKQNSDHIRFTVQDRGSGMSQESIDHAFEPFFTTKAKGTGLGLSICRRIVEAHGGTIQLKSKIDEGTTVIIELPCTHTEKRQEEES